MNPLFHPNKNQQQKSLNPRDMLAKIQLLLLFFSSHYFFRKLVYFCSVCFLTSGIALPHYNMAKVPVDCHTAKLNIIKMKLSFKFGTIDHFQY